MMNEVLANAVTGIDENLISDAENAGRKKNIIRPVFSICAVAACLVLVFTFIFTFGARYTGPELIMNDCIITDAPAFVDVPMTAMARETCASIEVHLTLNTRENTSIRISGGEMSVVSAENTDTLYYTGTEYTTDIPVNIHWRVDGSDTTTAYTLTLGGKTVYELTYDESDSLWSVRKQ